MDFFRSGQHFGQDCIYISNSEIKKDCRSVMNAIKTSVDKDIPVLAWGIAAYGEISETK